MHQERKPRCEHALVTGKKNFTILFPANAASKWAVLAENSFRISFPAPSRKSNFYNTFLIRAKCGCKLIAYPKTRLRGNDKVALKISLMPLYKGGFRTSSLSYCNLLLHALRMTSKSSNSWVAKSMQQLSVLASNLIKMYNRLRSKSTFSTEVLL